MLRLALLILLLAGPALAAQPAAPAFAFVSEYIRELAANEKSRAAAEHDISDANDKNAAILRNSNRIVGELEVQIRTLNGLRLSAPFDKIPGEIAQLYQYKIRANRDLTELIRRFSAQSTPGADAGSVAMNVQRLTGVIEKVNIALYDAVPLIFATLVERPPDKASHDKYLVITCAQRTELVDLLKEEFSRNLTETDPSYIVRGAIRLHDLLLDGYKCSDEKKMPSND